MNLVDALSLDSHRKIALVIDKNISISYQELNDQLTSLKSQIALMVNDSNPTFIQLFDENHLLIYSFLAASSLGPNTILDPKASLEEVIAKVGHLDFKYILCNKGTVQYALKIAKIMQCGVLLVHDKVHILTSELQISYIESIEKKESNGLVSPETLLILHTSGSTGTPKCVPLTHTQIITNIKQIAQNLTLGVNDNTICVMPLFHVHGLFASLLASLLSGSTIYLFSKAIDYSLFHDILLNNGITWYSAVPTIHHQIIITKKSNVDYKHSTLKLIRSSSSPLTKSLYERLHREFSVPIVQAYGMTEASHQIATQSYKDLPLPGSVGKATVADIKIINEEGIELPSNQHGEVVVQGTNVFDGYLFLDNTNYFSNGYFRTGDIGYLDEHQNLFLVARIKEFINKGGEKISPLTIDESLLKYPGVIEAVTYAVPHETLYEDIHAVVVMADGEPINEAEIKKFLYSHLSENQIPSRIYGVDKIPKSKTGKIQRVGMYKKFEKSLSDVIQKPTTNLELFIYNVYSQTLNITDFDIHANFFELGGNSLIANTVIYLIYKETNLSINYKTMIMHPSVYALANELTANKNNASNYYEFYEFFVSEIRQRFAKR